MTTARFGPTATLLTNGKVLLTGGQDASDTVLASAEIYDPATETFNATGSMSTGRYDFHTATLLLTGKVLVLGGYDRSNNAQSSAELYDPTTGAFSPTGSMTTGRYQHTATLLSDGKVLVAAGCYSANGAPCQTLASAELYDPTTETFSVTGSMTNVRALHTATLLTNGKVLVAGGADFNSYTSLASAELYDPTTGTFSLTGSMNTGRNSHSAALLSNGQALVATGYNYSSAIYLTSAELYNATTGTFTPTGSMTTGRIYQSAALVANGDFLVAGGANPSGLLASAEVYHPVTSTFSVTGSMTTARFISAATLLLNGQVLVAGGKGNAGVLASAELYTGAPKYEVCALYDQTRSVKSGAVFPIKLYLCDSSSNDASSSAIVLHATQITSISSYSGPAEAVGSANPDNDFRFDSTLGPAGGYIYNLGTSGLVQGTYSLHFSVTGDSTDHVVLFGVK